MTRLFAWIFGAMLASAIPGLALAADPVDKPFELSLTAGAAYVGLPNVNGFATAIDDRSFNFIRRFGGDTGIGIGPAFSLDFLSPTFDGPDLLGGARINVELDGIWATASASTETELEPDELLDLLPIDGGPSPGALFTTPQRPREDVDAQFLQFEAAFDIDQPLRSVGPTNLSVLLGPRVAYQEQNFEATIVDDLRLTDTHYELDERVWTIFAGPEIGFKATTRFANDVELHLTTRAAALWYRAELNADQSFMALPPVGLGRNHAFDAAEDFSTRLELTTGFTMPLRNSRMFFSLDGSVVWWTAVPEIVNPSSSPGVVASSHDFTASHLGKGNMLTAALTARLTLPIE